MNLDELTKNIRRISKEEVLQKLANHISEWKTDEKNAIDLRESVERFLGNTWFEKQAEFDKVYEMWTEFKSSAIDGIGGMTMNERLYCFGLLELFDKELNNKEQEKFYAKLMAKK